MRRVCHWLRTAALTRWRGQLFVNSTDLSATFKRAQSRLRASLIAQLVKKLPAMQRPRFNSWVGKICWRRDRLPTPVFLDFHCGSAGKESTCNVGDLGSIPVLGRSPGEGKGYPLQYSGQENSTDCIVHGVKESEMTERLSLHNQGSTDNNHKITITIKNDLYIHNTNIINTQVWYMLHIYTHIWDKFHLNISTYRSNNVLIKQIFSSHFCLHSKKGKKPRTETISLALLALSNQIPCY